MKTNLIILSILITMTSATTRAQHKALFGTDNRRDIYQTPSHFRPLASGMGSWTSPYLIEKSGNLVDYIFPTIGEEYGLCQGEKFFSQPTNTISCTGFLVGPDLLMTAGHCMVNVGRAENEATPMCTDFRWAFDYYLNGPQDNILKGQPSENVLECEKVLFAAHDGDEDERLDIALIKLKRPLKERHHFKFSKNKLHKGQQVFIMGFPSGLPLKFAGNAFVNNVREGSQYFEASVDAVGGNSGSPVFDTLGEVLGVLVRGNDDFYTDERKNCDRWNKCNQVGSRCRDGVQESDYDNGMHVQKIPKFIKELVKKNSNPI